MPSCDDIMFDEKTSRVLPVHSGRFSWKTFLPVDSVHNFFVFFTSGELANHAAFRVIHGVPRSMKERME